MRKSIKRSIAITFAFIQLFFAGLASGEKNTSDNTSETQYVLVDNKNVPIYKRVDSETGEYETISIFDEENLKSHQYGASQRVFKNNFNELVNDPLIWEEMQTVKPVESFECIEDAIFWYQKYFEVIYECGCGYAVAADYVFHYFEGREDEFYKTFGYPMYTYKEGKLDFNYELFMLKFFNFLNIVMNNKLGTIEKMIEREFNEYKLYSYIESDSPKKQIGKKQQDWTEEDYDLYDKLSIERDAKVKELSDKYKNSPKKRDVYENLGVTLDGSFGYLYILLANHGINLDISCNFDAKSFAIDDIVACDNSIMNQLFSNGEVGDPQNIGLHYVYVVGVEKGKVIVSSWGNKYLLDYSVSPNNQTVKLKAH